MPNRLATLQERLADEPFDILVLVPGPNSYYASGADLHASERLNLLFIPTQGEPVALIPGLEAPALYDLDMRRYEWRDEDGPAAALAALVADLGVDAPRLGIEYSTMRYFESEALRTALPHATLVNADAFLATQRAHKDAAEVEAVRHAIAVTEKALGQTIEEIEVGMTENQVARQLIANLLAAGADHVPFCLVVSGPRAAEPHSRANERVIQAGDVIIIDCGATVNHYSGDITRVVAMEPVPAEIERIYEVCCAANQAGREASRAGATGHEIDAASRRVIEEAGYGEYFIHRTGHGLGLEVHEPPYMVAGNHTPLEVGNLFTVEPGIYIPGVGGVRVEDDVLITEDGHESLTTFPRELIRIG